MKKGIILAAGSGTRLGPITQGIRGNNGGVSKPLVLTCDKPTIYYSLSDLISAGINHILIVTAPECTDDYVNMLGDGTELGVKISYTTQPEPLGIAHVFMLDSVKEFIGDASVALTFGDNVFSGDSFTEEIRNCPDPKGATGFAYKVDDPTRFGVVEFDDKGRAISIEEKPTNPKSDFAVVGIYFYDNSVVEVAKGIEMSDRGEYEITSINEAYLDKGKLEVVTLGEDVDWFDTGTVDSLMEAHNFVYHEQKRTGRLIGSPEYAAYSAGFITRDQLLDLAVQKPLWKSGYGKVLKGMVEKNVYVR